MQDQPNFKDLLYQTYQWPDFYDFKFIVKSPDKELVLEKLKGFNIVETPSKQGHYIAVTARKLVKSSDEVIEIYQLVGSIKGVMSL